MRCQLCLLQLIALLLMVTISAHNPQDTEDTEGTLNPLATEECSDEVLRQCATKIGLENDDSVQSMNSTPNNQPLASDNACSLTAVPDVDMIDCMPDESSGRDGCLARGCCWRPQFIRGPPWCFYPRGYPPANYRMVGTLNTSDDGFKNDIEKATHHPHWPRDILRLRVEASYISSRVARIRIIDPRDGRFEVPVDVNIEAVRKRHHHLTRNYLIHVNNSISMPYAVSLTRLSDGQTLFNTSFPTAPLIFSDQFLQITSRLPSTTVFGIGEREATFMQIVNNWTTIGLYARDTVPRPNVNLYGVHNFMLGMIANAKWQKNGTPQNASAYGIFFRNSHAHEVVLQPNPAITYRTIGGVLDFFIFTTENPRELVADYWTLIGTPSLPPYWTLGFHLSIWGYNDTEHMRRTLTRNLAQHMPVDGTWADIDYMDRYLIWTVDPQRHGESPEYIRQMRQHFVMVVDPGVSALHPGEYPVYDEGLSQGIYVNKSDVDEPIVGTVWPERAVYPDFTNEKDGRVLRWWTRWMRRFRRRVLFSGVWLDMNEPANFIYGSVDGCTASHWDNPPYTPHIDHRSINQFAVCASARLALGRMYDLHSLYGHYEGKATFLAFRQVVPGIRPFVLSRSTFAGSGRYVAHWSGDNRSTWSNLYHSIVQILNFNLFGIPMNGADVCGFLFPVGEELCTRWMQLGTFYPFMRNHNDKRYPDKDPAVWSYLGRKRMLDTLRLRYSLLPYIYTHLHHATTHHHTLVHPIFFFYPHLFESYAIDTQFLLGPVLMVAPVLKSNATELRVFFPHEEAWCDLHTMSHSVFPLNQKQWHVIPVTMDNIPVYIRGGQILSLQGWKMLDSVLNEATMADDYRRLPFTFIACVNTTGGAEGDLVVDDGLSWEEMPLKRFTVIQYRVDTVRGFAEFLTTYRGFPLSKNARHRAPIRVPLHKLVLLGVEQPIKQLQVTHLDTNGAYVRSLWNQFHLEGHKLIVSLGDVDLLQQIVHKVTLHWSH